MARYDIWATLGFTGNPYSVTNLPSNAEGAALFCGRLAELTRTQVGVASGGSHVAIEGDAGVGKTSLAQVAAFDMLQDGLRTADGTLFVPVEAKMQLGPDPAEFEREVWRNIANALIVHRDDLKRARLNLPELAGLERWLNSPTVMTGGSASVLGFGGSATTGLNTASGFGQSGYISHVRRELARTFPSPAAGGVICVLDNLELVQTSEAARAALDSIRGSLLEVPSIRWILVGSKGIISSARSRRLSAFIDIPIQLVPLTIDESVELVERRLAYWGTERSHAPVQPEDFRYLYRALGLNLRDSLQFAEQFAKHYVTEFVLGGADVPGPDERPLFFQTWLREQAEQFSAEISNVDAWEQFDLLCDAGGSSSIESDDAKLALMEPLRRAHLIEIESDSIRLQVSNVTVTAAGWLCHSARPQRKTTALPPKKSPEKEVSSFAINSIAASLAAPFTNCRLLRLLDFTYPSVQEIRSRWESSPRSTAVAIGLSESGPLVIDFRRDGPHALIGGTTGSGKSELLRTIVAALAIANRPDELTFVLIDYKGGAAFGQCSNLPHTATVVTDLDNHLFDRVIRSLRAEIERRKALLRDAGAYSFDEFRLMDSAGPLPRLMIFVDEFAALAYEFADSLNDLVAIAQIGRSLGIHLVLATQRPAGVVNRLIRANMNLRIALRTADAEDSIDLLNSPEASMISKFAPGRATVRLAAGELIVFQSALVSSHESPGQNSQDRDNVEAETDLQIIVRIINDATTALKLDLGPPVVLPPLPQVVLLSSLNHGPKAAANDGQIPLIPYGLEDHADEQSRAIASLDFQSFSHLAILGAPRTGRSQALVTIAASISANTSPGDVQIHAFDCGSGALLSLTALPHCGTITIRSEGERGTQLLDRLVMEVSRRYEILIQSGHAGFNEHRESVSDRQRLPHIVVMIDRWESFANSFDGSGYGHLTSQLISLVNDGPAVGVHLVVSGDDRLLFDRLGSQIEEKIALRLADRNSYLSLGGRGRQLPDDIPPGRGFRSSDFTEIQIALLVDSENVQAQAQAVRSLGEELTTRYSYLPESQRPFRVDSPSGPATP